ncbi:MAG: 4'-phosphopantetheinyl transferase superfamily protein [Clostridiales bacterium]|nr:4'-phosphopantetheinyl transferase superfamily protein [Clostridiales bacterium]
MIIYIWKKEEEGGGATVPSLARDYAAAAGMISAQGLLLMPEPVIVRDERGKPRFAAESGGGYGEARFRWADVHFSLSHSGVYCACAFHTRPVGLDLQIHRECRREAVARRFFHPAEYAWLEKGGFKSFFQVWAAKESYVKYTGAGLAGGLDKFSVVEGGGLACEITRGDSSPVALIWPRESHPHCVPDNYSICLCAEPTPDLPIEVFCEE